MRILTDIEKKELSSYISKIDYLDEIFSKDIYINQININNFI